MAIKNRRGAYADFDPYKMVPGEWGVTTSGDPNSSDGKSVYMCFATGDVKRMATYDDMVENVDRATEEVQEKLTQDVREATSEANSATQKATQAATSANQSAERANAAAALTEGKVDEINQAVRDNFINNSVLSDSSAFSNKYVDENFMRNMAVKTQYLNYKGLLCYVFYTDFMATVVIKGTLNETIYTKARYEIIISLMIKPKQNIIKYVLYSSIYMGQIYIETTGAFKIGFAKDRLSQTDVDLDSGRSIYIFETFVF